MVEIVGGEDAAAHAMARVHGKAHVILPIHAGDARVVGAGDLFIAQFQHGLAFHLPVDAVIAESEANVGAGKIAAFFLKLFPRAAIVVAEQHNVAAVFLDDAGVEGQVGIVGHVLAGEDGLGVPRDDGTGAKERFGNHALASLLCITFVHTIITHRLRFFHSAGQFFCGIIVKTAQSVSQLVKKVFLTS